MNRHALWQLSLMAIFLLASLPQWAQAADITVDESTCTLADAITSANNDTATGGCAAGSGADTITLQADVTLAAALPSKITAPLIQIESTITIEGGGHKIDGNSLGPVLWIAGSGVLTLNRAVITGGKAACYCGTNGIISSGGGIYNEGQLSLTNSTITGNRADGIHTNMGSLTVSNTTISESKPDAICMIAGCEGVGGGSGIHVSGGGTVILRSSVISGNVGWEILVLEGTITADSYNVFGHSGKSNADAFYDFIPGTKDVTATSDGTKPTALEAILSPLADNGGETQTYALPAGSPAIDLDKDCSTELTEDQRGYTRPVGNGCDAGAFESTYSAPTTFTVTPSAGDGGSVTPDAAQAVNEGDTASFTVTPDAGYTTDEVVSGTCPEGTWEGSTYTTGQIDADCTVEFSFIADKKKINMVPIYKLLLN